MRRLNLAALAALTILTAPPAQACPRDIDAVVAAARDTARNANVFLHSAGTGFTARYAATDFNLSGEGPADPGYERVRGLVLLEGGGGSTAGAPLTEDALDRIVARADGGLFGAVRDNAPRCVDGTTPCTVAGEAADCAGQTPPTCTPPTAAYSIVAGLLNPRILASAEPVAIQGITDPNGDQAMLSAPQGAPDNTAIMKVPDLGTLQVLGPGTVAAGLGGFLDDDGLVAQLAFFVATSMGEPGPMVDGLNTWRSSEDGPPSAAVVPDNGPAPTTLPARIWGHAVESTRFDRIMQTFYAGGSNFTDWYYPSWRRCPAASSPSPRASAPVPRRAATARRGWSTHNRRTPPSPPSAAPPVDSKRGSARATRTSTWCRRKTTARTTSSRRRPRSWPATSRERALRSGGRVHR
jgi:hypothetical protein